MKFTSALQFKQKQIASNPQLNKMHELIEKAIHNSLDSQFEVTIPVTTYDGLINKILPIYRTMGWEVVEIDYQSNHSTLLFRC